MSNHGYLKPGQWVQLTKHCIFDYRTPLVDDLYTMPSSAIIQKGTFIRYEGRRKYNEMVFTINKHEYTTIQSDIKYKAISPSKSKALEVLYGV